MAEHSAIAQNNSLTRRLDAAQTSFDLGDTVTSGVSNVWQDEVLNHPIRTAVTVGTAAGAAAGITALAHRTPKLYLPLAVGALIGAATDLATRIVSVGSLGVEAYRQPQSRERDVESMAEIASRTALEYGLISLAVVGSVKGGLRLLRQTNRYELLSNAFENSAGRVPKLEMPWILRARPTFAEPGSQGEKLYRSLNDKVVRITSPNSGGGSGFLQDGKDGYVVTNSHVAKPGENYEVRLSGNRWFNARLVGRDETADLALLKADGALTVNLPEVQLGSSESLSKGAPLYIIGHPEVVAQSVLSEGRMLKHGPETSAKPTIAGIEFDNPILPGNSGSPIFNKEAQVIGITTTFFPNKTAWGVTSEHIDAFVKAVKANEHESGWVEVNSMAMLNPKAIFPQFSRPLQIHTTASIHTAKEVSPQETEQASTDGKNFSQFLQSIDGVLTGVGLVAGGTTALAARGIDAAYNYRPAVTDESKLHAIARKMFFLNEH